MDVIQRFCALPPEARAAEAERDKFHYVLTAIAYTSDLMPASILRESALLVCGEKKEAES